MSALFGALRLPSSVIIGCGQRNAIGPIAARYGARALICTDARMGGDPQFLELVANLQAHGVQAGIFDKTEADLPIDGIANCVEQFHDIKP